VLAGPTFAHITITNLCSAPNSVTFLDIALITKGYKCLDIVTGRVYVSRDVVFDELVFTFAALHSNVGARLRAEISLLPPFLLESTSYGGRSMEIDHMPKSIDASLQLCAMQDSSQVPLAEDRAVLLPGSDYILEDAVEHRASGLMASMDPGERPGVAPLGVSAPTPTLDRLPGSCSSLVLQQPMPACNSASDTTAVVVPGGFLPSTAEIDDDVVGSSASAAPTPQHSSPASPGDPGFVASWIFY
jgi:hypothetical protein